MWATLGAASFSVSVLVFSAVLAADLTGVGSLLAAFTGVVLGGVGLVRSHRSDRTKARRDYVDENLNTMQATIAMQVDEEKRQRQTIERQRNRIAELTEQVDEVLRQLEACRRETAAVSDGWRRWKEEHEQ